MHWSATGRCIRSCSMPCERGRIPEVRRKERGEESMATAPKKTLQGPRGHWLLGCLRQFQRDPLTLYTQANRDYGHYVRIRAFPGIYVYLLTHPEAVEHVLQKNHKNYRKPDFFNKTVGLLAGNGILTSEGDFWLRQRRLMQPAFHRQHLAKLAPLMVAAAESFVREQQAAGPGQVVDILDAMMKVALRIAGNTLFSTDITGEADEIGRAFRTAFAYVSRRMNSPPLIPTWFLLGQHPQIQADLYDEIRGKLQGRSPTLDDLPGLPLTKAVFEESLRLYP